MKRVLVVGGGFFGMYVAEFCARKGHAVRLVEKEPLFMSRASYVNQARVHSGYHYPRSMLTALRSRASFARFAAEFPDCINKDFTQLYLIATTLGKVTARQFRKFCERLELPCEPAPTPIRAMTHPTLVEECFITTEYAFNAVHLRQVMTNRLAALGVAANLSTAVEAICQEPAGLVAHLRCDTAGTREHHHCDHVFNCTYSLLNELNARSRVPIIPLKHELAEICLVRVPPELRRIGITVMCGPFFSLMPFPATDLHSFSHVRYTPHVAWLDDAHAASGIPIGGQMPESTATAWKHMQRDAARYVPCIAECLYQRSLWEVKTVLPRSESDDSRPILFRPNHGIPGYHCLMGGKIDNVYDVIAAIELSGILA